MEFPENIITVLADVIKEKMPGIEAASVVMRSLRPSDPAEAIGIFAVDWMPGAAEIGGRGPTDATYQLRIQYLVKHTDEEEGRLKYAVGSKNLRVILAHGPELPVRLGGLAEESFGRRERVQRFGVRNQRFLNNEIRGVFMYLSATDFWVETESMILPV